MSFMQEKNIPNLNEISPLPEMPRIIYYTYDFNPVMNTINHNATIRTYMTASTGEETQLSIREIMRRHHNLPDLPRAGQWDTPWMIFNEEVPEDVVIAPFRRTQLDIKRIGSEWHVYPCASIWLINNLS